MAFTKSKPKIGIAKAIREERKDGTPSTKAVKTAVDDARKAKAKRK